MGVQGGESIGFSVHTMRLRPVIDWLLQFAKAYVGIMVLFVGHLPTHDSVLCYAKDASPARAPARQSPGHSFTSKPPLLLLLLHYSYTTFFNHTARCRTVCDLYDRDFLQLCDLSRLSSIPSGSD